MYKQINLSPIKLETERLIIKPFQNSDFENSVLLYGDSKITQYFDFGVPRSQEEVKDMIDYYCNFLQQTKYLGLFSIFNKENIEFIGHIDCIPHINTNTLEIGFIIKHVFQHLGFAFEALNLFLYDYITEIKNKINGYKFNKVIATAHPQNINSIKLIEKLGMRFECKTLRFNKQPRYKYFLNI